VEPQERARRLSGGVTHGGRVLRLVKAESTRIESGFRRLGKKIVSTNGHAID
jgi:hypothetical protein